MTNSDVNPQADNKSKTQAINIISGGIGNYPIRLELVPKRLIVSIYQQSLMGRGSHIPCWVFVTEGMEAFKQKEFVLALRIEDADDYKKFPKLPLQLFMHLYKAVAQKKRFHIGSVIPLGEKGLMGFAGMGYTHNLINSNEIKLPGSHLSCLFLTREELQAARTMGLTRVLARLGYETNRFPINPWNEMKRTGLPMQSVIKDSQFKGITTLVLEHSSVNLVNGEQVTLILSPLIQPVLSKFIKENSASAQLGLITQLFSYHEGALSWLPMKDTVEMNVHPDSDGELIAGSFLVLAKAEASGATMLEDGFLINLSSESWALLKNAVNTRKHLQIDAKGGQMAFNLVWNLKGNSDLHSGLKDQATAETTSHDQGSGLINKLKSLFKR